MGEKNRIIAIYVHREIGEGLWITWRHILRFLNLTGQIQEVIL